jgi:hypothetical protein
MFVHSISRTPFEFTPLRMSSKAWFSSSRGLVCVTISSMVKFQSPAVLAALAFVRVI